MIKKLLLTILFATFPITVYGASYAVGWSATTTTGTILTLPALINGVRAIPYLDTLCFTGDVCRSSWPTGGGSAGGPWSTTTSQVSGILNVYTNNTTDVVAIGSNSTTTAEYWFDPTALRAYLAGSVGIGTTSPLARLSVKGSDTGSTKSFIITNSSDQERFSVTNAGTALVMGNLQVKTTDLFGFTMTPSNVSPYTNTLGVGGGEQIAFQEGGETWMLINADGKVGIGTTTPGAQLEVFNASGQVMILDSSSNGGAYTTTKADAVVLGYDGGGSSILTNALTSSMGVRAQGAYHIGTGGDNVRVTVDSAVGNVGIGTTTPQSILSVNSGTFNASVIALNNSFNQASNRNWAFALNQNEYGDFHIMQGSAQNSPATAGNTRLVIEATGNVGVGTTTPTGKLTVYGTASEPSLTHDAYSNFNIVGYAGGTDLVFTASNVSPYAVSIQNRHSTIDGNSYPIALNSGGGNVGVGTSSISGVLHVAGSVGTAPANNTLTTMRLESSATPAVGAGPSILFRGRTGNSTGQYGFAGIQGAKESVSAENYSGYLSLFTQQGSTAALTEVMRLNGSGYVGIGSTTPFERLTVAGNAYIGGNLTATGTVTFTGISDGCANFTSGVLGSTGSACGAGGGGSGGGTWSTTTSTVAGRLTNYPNNTSDIVTIGSNSTTTAEYWFDPNTTRSYLSGYVGIGTVSPDLTLDIETASNQGTLIGNQSGNLGAGTLTNVTSGIGFRRSTDGAVATGIFNYDDTAGVPGLGLQSRGDITLMTTAGDKHLVLSQNDYAGFVFDLGVGTTTPRAPLHVGNNMNTVDSNDPAVLVSRDVSDASGTGSAHGFVDLPAISRSGAGTGYAAFDARTQYSGTSDYDHWVGLQSLPVYGTSGTLNDMYGVFHAPVINSGTVVDSYGAWLQNPSGAGAVTNNYGLYIDNMTKGATNNYSIYSAGGKNYFAGNTGMGTTSPFEKLSIAGNAYVGGNLTATGTLRLTALSDGCLNITSGSVGSTGSACGSGGGASTEKWATSSVDSTAIYTNAASKVGIGTSTPYQALSVVGDIVADNMIETIGYNLNGGGTTISTTGSSSIVWREIHATSSIVSWTLVGDLSGNITVDIKKATYADYPNFTSIVAGDPPQLSSAIKNSSTALTGWTRLLTPGDILQFSASGTPATTTKINLSLKVKRI